LEFGAHDANDQQAATHSTAKSIAEKRMSFDKPR